MFFLSEFLILGCFVQGQPSNTLRSRTEIRPGIPTKHRLTHCWCQLRRSGLIPPPAIKIGYEVTIYDNIIWQFIIYNDHMNQVDNIEWKTTMDKSWFRQPQMEELPTMNAEEHPRDWLHLRVKYHGVDLQICQSFRSNCPSTLGPTDQAHLDTRTVPPNAEDKLGFGHALWLRMYHINLWHYMHWNRIKTDSCGTAKEMNLWHKRIEAKSTSHPGKTSGWDD